MTAPATAYPSRPVLTPSDMREALSVGPDLRWLFPFLVLGEVRTSRPNSMPYGLVHRYFDAYGNLRRDVQYFYSVQDVRWAADRLYRTHSPECRCMDVFYWEPKTVNYGIEHYGAAAA